MNIITVTNKYVIRELSEIIKDYYIDTLFDRLNTKNTVPLRKQQDVFTTLIKCIFKWSEIEHIESGGRKWYPFSTSRIQRKHIPEDILENKLYCDGSDSDEHDDCLTNEDVLKSEVPELLKNSEVTNPNNWKYCLKWDNFDFDYKYFDDYLEDEINLIGITPNSIAYIGTIVLEYGWFNHDHRGSDHCLLPTTTDFINNVELTNPTLEDLAITLYRMKSHKWDYYYELFCDCEIEYEKDKLILKLGFDHGS